MPTNEEIPKPIRQLNLVKALMRSRSGITMADVAELEGYQELLESNSKSSAREQKKADAALRRRFQRDRKELGELGIHIDTLPSDEPRLTIYRLSPTSLLTDPIQLDSEELLLLDALTREFKDIRGTDTSRLLMSAVAKLKAGSAGSPHVSASAVGTLQRALASTPTELQRFDRCFVAQANRVPIEFRYLGSQDIKPKLRRVEPYGIVRRGGYFYVIGRDTDQNEVRVFRLSRMRGVVKVLRDADSFEVPAAFDTELHFAPHLLSGGHNALRNVKISFDADVGFVVANDFKGVHFLVEHRRGNVTLTIASAYPSELFRYLAEFAGHFEVLAPKALRADFKARLEETLAVYHETHD